MLRRHWCPPLEVVDGHWLLLERLDARLGWLGVVCGCCQPAKGGSGSEMNDGFHLRWIRQVWLDVVQKISGNVQREACGPVPPMNPRTSIGAGVVWNGPLLRQDARYGVFSFRSTVLPTKRISSSIRTSNQARRCSGRTISRKSLAFSDATRKETTDVGLRRGFIAPPLPFPHTPMGFARRCVHRKALRLPNSLHTPRCAIRRSLSS